MTDLLATVRSRYGRHPAFHNMFSLAYRKPFRPKRSTGRLLSPHTGLIESMGHTLGKKIEQLEARQTHSEQRRGQAENRFRRQADLRFHAIEQSLVLLHRKTGTLGKREEARLREAEQRPRQDMPLGYRSAKRMTEERVAQAEATLRTEQALREKQVERKLLRRLQDDEYYENRRRGR